MSSPQLTPPPSATQSANQPDEKVSSAREKLLELEQLFANKTRQSTESKQQLSRKHEDVIKAQGEVIANLESTHSTLLELYLFKDKLFLNAIQEREKVEKTLGSRLESVMAKNEILTKQLEASRRGSNVFPTIIETKVETD